MEHGGDGLYEPLDLQIAPCRMMVCGYDAPAPVGRRMRIATKYTEITRRFYAARGEQVELIKLYGSMELGPIVGLSDRIADLVDTGNTVKADGLVPLELICNISSRLVVNKAALKMKHAAIMDLVEKRDAAVAARRDEKKLS
jgi:ATP phosphoribosyltransferase